jgi:heptose-I-phosphate ethanolaminephosphotransferase
MGIYNHFRNTTPRQLMQVEKYGLQVFDNTYSNAGNTMRSLSFALTEANQYNKKDYLDSLSFIDIFNKANFDTTWIAAQPILAETNTIVSIIAKSSKHVTDLINNVKVKTGLSSPYDENAIEELRKRISDNKDKNLLVIIHLYGNHFKYTNRYPEKYSIYKKVEPYVLGTNKAYILEDYSNYDNSVYYNDFVVSNLLNVIKKYGGVSAFLYFSDHSEAISRHRGHTSRLESFTYTMTQIPFTAWLSPEYIKRYPKTYKTFISHKDSLFSNDMIYDTIIGLAHIKTDHYYEKYDTRNSYSTKQIENS